MTLKGLRDLCAFSREEDWNVIALAEAAEGGAHADAHQARAVYRPNVSVSMAWGKATDLDVPTDLADELDGAARAAVVEFFYNGALVDRERYLVVDDGSAYLPLPRREDGRLVITLWQDAFFRFLDGLEKDSRFDEYKGRAGIEVELIRD